MAILRHFIYGIGLSAAYLAMIFIGDSALPGRLSLLAYSPLALLALLSMMVLESMYSLR